MPPRPRTQPQPQQPQPQPPQEPPAEQESSARREFLLANRGKTVGQATYRPGYWENPEKIVAWRNKIAADPNTELPEGMTRENLQGLYDYLKFRNQNRPTQAWFYLSENDPMRGYLTSLKPPDERFVSKDDVIRYGIPTAQQKAAQTPGGTSQINWKQPDFDWSRLTVQQKQSVLKDPGFRIKDVTALGQQGLILSDPEFDFLGKTARGELPWWQLPAFYALSNPATAPLGQAALMGGVTTLASGSKTMGAVMAGGALALGYSQYLPDKGVGGLFKYILQKAGQGLMWGAQTVEQVSGTASYLSAGRSEKVQPWQVLLGPLIGGAVEAFDIAKGANQSDRWEQFRSDPEYRAAVWEASKLFYETLGKDLDTGEVWVLGENEKVPVLPGYTLDDARQRIMDGESADVVFMDFQRAYGVSGVMSDFALQAVYDPLNPAPSVVGGVRTTLGAGKYASMLNEMNVPKDMQSLSPAQLLQQGTITESQAARLAIQRAHVEASRQKPTVTGEMIPWSEGAHMFRDLVRSNVSEISTTRMAEVMSGWDRFKAGLTPEGKIKELVASEQKPAIWNLWNSFTLQPKSKAIMSGRVMFDNIGVLMNWADEMNVTATTRNVLDAYAKGDMQAVKNMGAQFLDNPEMYSMLGAVRDFMPKVESRAAAFDLAANQRAAALHMAEILGDDVHKVVKRFLDGDARPDFEAFKAKAGEQGLNELAALLGVTREQLTPDSLAKALEVFRDGAVELTPQEYKYNLLGDLEDFMNDWGKEYYKVDPNDTTVASLFRLMKNAQSMALLDFSPSYYMNNMINENILLMAGGAFNVFEGAKSLDGWVDKFGVKPAGYGEAGTPAGIPETRAPRAGKGEGAGLIQRLADASGDLRKKIGIFNNLTAKMNEVHGKRAYVDAMKKFYGSNWRAGNGFEFMSPQLEQTLRAKGIDPRQVYRAIEGKLDPAELGSIIQQGVSNHAVESYVDGAAESLGLEPGRAGQLLNELGVLDELREGLSTARTPAERARVFDRVTRNAMNSIDVRESLEIRNRATHFKQAVQAEGFAGAHNIIMDVQGSLEKRWIDHYVSAGELQADLAKVTDTKTRNALYRNWRTSEQGYWRRYYAYEASAWKGMLEGLGTADPQRKKFLGLLAEYMDANQKLTAEQMAAYDKHFSDDRSTFDDFAKLEATFDAKWKLAEKRKAAVWKKIDDLTVQIFRENFGDVIGVNARRWVDEKAAFHQQMVTRRQEFRDSTVGMDRVEKTYAKWKFYQEEYPQMIRDFTARNMGNEGQLFKTEPPEPPLNPADMPAGTPPPRPEMEADQIRQEAEAAFASEQQARDQRDAAIWDMAEQFSKAEGVPYNRASDKYALMGALRKTEYGGDPSWTSLEDVPSEKVQEILTRREEARRTEIVKQEETAETAAINRPRSTLPEPVSEALLQEARRIADVIAGGEPGKRSADAVTSSTYPDWYNELQKAAGGRQKLLGALEKVIKDAGSDKGVVVARVKEFLISNIKYGDDATGQPPNISVLKLLGADDVTLQAAVDIFNEQMGTRFTLEDVLQIEQPKDFDVAEWHHSFEQAAKDGDLTRMYELAGDMPDELGEMYNDMISRTIDETVIRVENEHANQLIAQQMARADQIVDHVEGRLPDILKNKLPDDEPTVPPLDPQRVQENLQQVQQYSAARLQDRQLSFDDVQQSSFDDADLQQMSFDDIMNAAKDETQYGHPGRPLDEPTLQARGEAIQSALDTQAANRRTRGRVLADSISKNFRDHGSVSLTGHTVRSVDDLAVLAQVYRNPKYETFRYIFVRGDEVVGDIGISGRIPGSTRLFPTNAKGDDVADFSSIKQQMDALGADGYYVMHNHPSGESRPSAPDVFATQHLASQLDGFKGHVVIDHNEYSIVNRDGSTQTFEKDLSPEYDVTNPEEAVVPHPVIGRVISGPADVMALGTELTGEQGHITIIGASSRMKVRSVLDLTPEELGSDTRAAVTLRKFAQETGTGQMFGVVDNPEAVLGPKWEKKVRQAIKTGLLVDFIYTDARGRRVSFRQNAGAPPDPNFILGKLEPGVRSGEAAPFNKYRLTEEQGTYSLFQDGGNTPVLPPGGYDQLSQFVPMSKLMEDGWTDKVMPLLNAMKEQSQKPENRYTFDGLDPQTSQQLNRYLNQTRSRMASVKHATVRYGETMKNHAMLDYNRQFNIDKPFSAGVPYEFYGTRSGINWIPRVLDRPAWMSNLARLYRLHNTYQNQLPERMRNKYFIPMPFLPKWAGGGTFIDPTSQLFPFKMFLQPFEAYSRDQAQLSNSAMYVLRNWAEDGTITPEEAQAALQSRSGADWDRALEEAKLQQGETKNGADYFGMLFSPALYLTLPYYLATGKKSGDMGWPSGQLPVTRFGQGMETAFKGTSLEWLGNAAGLLAKPEKWAREELGLSEFGEWGDFYIDRQIANMVTEGVIDSRVAQMAMIERKGDVFDQAQQRVREELMLKVPGIAPLYGLSHGATWDAVLGSVLPSMFPGGLLPPGEMEYKGLKQEYGLVWEAWKSGNKDAFKEFFEKHPEYEARLGLRRDPAERMTQFLRSEIWDAYSALGATDKKQAAAYMGEEFSDFLSSEPGVEFSTEQLALWSKMLKGMVPVTGETQAVIEGETPRIDFMSPEVTAVTDRYFEERKEKFPNYYNLQTTYFSLPKNEQRRFLLQFPRLKEYWDWNRDWKDAYPEYKDVFNGKTFRRIDTSNWPPTLLSMTTQAAYTGGDLSEGARAVLRQLWQNEGQPYGDFDSWVFNQVYPSIINQDAQAVMQGGQ